MLFRSDIKIEGLSTEIMSKALYQAKEGRMHILGIMNECISEPKDDVSQYAPRFSAMKIPVDMIGAVIGSGGETIRSICKEHSVEINIEDDGTVMIAATNKDSSDSARKVITGLVSKPKEGEVYKATVKEIREGLGAIMEFLPKTQGLLHISQLAYERVDDVGKVLSVGEKVEVKLIEITRDGKYRLSRKALLPKPEGYVERERPANDERHHSSSARPNQRSGGNRR